MTKAAPHRDDRGDWRFAGEYITNETPFTVRRAVRWAECDPAGVVYLGNFPHYLLSAVHLRTRSVLVASTVSGFATAGLLVWLLGNAAA